MLFAATLPAPIARITVAAPETISPPANTPGRDVACLSSATMLPLLFVSRLSVVEVISLFASVPKAIITRYQLQFRHTH